MNRLFPFALLASSLVAIYACSSSSDDSTAPPDTTDPEGGIPPGPTDDASTPVDGEAPDTSVPPNDNPIDGASAPTAVAALDGLSVVGPLWHGDGLFYAVLQKDGQLIKLTPPSDTVPLDGPATAGHEILGTTFDEKASTFVTCEVAAAAGAEAARGGQIVRRPLAGMPHTALALTFTGTDMFDSPKNVVARKSDGILYVTDPGYQTQPQSDITNNHIWRINTTGHVIGLVADGRPNGIAFSPDQKTLYVSFTADPPKVAAFPVGADGSLGAEVAFASEATGSQPDGVAVDTSGNVYVGNTTGVDVFKADGTKWGHITTTKPINGLAFGNADKKTLYMTTDTVGMFQVTVKIPGL